MLIREEGLEEGGGRGGGFKYTYKEQKYSKANQGRCHQVGPFIIVLIREEVPECSLTAARLNQGSTM